MAEHRPERRTEPRVSSLNLVSVAQFDEQGFRADLTVGRTMDLSCKGVRVELNRALPLRSKVRLTLALGHDILEVEGTVCHLEVLDEHTCSMGLQFQRVSDHDAQTIDEYLGTVSNSG